MRTAKQTSTAALMSFVVLAALELALFQEVWFIVLSPPVTMAVLGLNLGIFFLAVRPKLLKTRILGMLLGGLAACFATALATLGSGETPVDSVMPYRNVLIDWASTRPIDQGLTVSVLRFLIAHSIAIEFILLDLLGLAMIFWGGWVEHRWYRRDPANERKR